MSDAKTEPRCNFPGHHRGTIKAIVQDCLDCGVTIVTPVDASADPDVADYTKCECCALSYEQGHRDGYQAGYTQGMNDRGNPN